MVVERVERSAGVVRLSVRPRGDEGVCPRCGRPSTRVHSRYERRLADVAGGGQPVVVHVRVRRFFCDATTCPARTFAEQVDGLTSRYARRTPSLRRALEAIGLALAGRAGARLAGRLGMPASRSGVLRLVRALPEPAVGSVAVLGVDDFALRRNRAYGTVLVDLGSHRPVDLLADREAATLAAWLRRHPGTTVVCRDRAGAYAEGARRGAPGAIQVADRWHLWHNLASDVEAAVARHRACLAAAEPAAAGPCPELADGAKEVDPAPSTERVAAERAEERALVGRTRERHAAVHALRAQGKGLKAVVRELGLARETVRRYARAADVEDLLAAARDGRPSVLDEFKPHLHHRWDEGCTSATALFAEVRALGYRGGYGTVRRYLRPFRTLGAVAVPPPPAGPVPPPKVRDVAGWMLRHPDDLNADEHVRRKEVLARCPHLDALARHVASFADMMVGLRGDRLDAWIAEVKAADELAGLRPFVRGLERDRAAVANGLTLPHSSGAVEGNVNRIKTLKRQMYGRAGFDLLRKRVLLRA